MTASARVETGISSSPGWRVVVAGEPGAARAPDPDEALLAAEVPAGTRRLDLLYRPAGFVAGMLLAALGLALLLGWAIEPPR